MGVRPSTVDYSCNYEYKYQDLTMFLAIELLHCVLAAAQCIVIRAVCLCVFVAVCLSLCGSVTTITQIDRSLPNTVCW